MKCPKCQNFDTKVLDSRVVQDGNAIRRRRECEYCEHRFTTFERRGITDLIVIKKDWSREIYDKSKITKALLLAFGKRNVSTEKIEEITALLELGWAGESEITSVQIGEDLLRALKNEDTVAYVRFASVYMNFNSREDFQDLIVKE
jgi:transcriptional repressor NrdR